MFKNQKAILAWRHFLESNHVFNKNGKFIIIYQFSSITKSKGVSRQRMMERENFWIQTLQRIHKKGLNQELFTY